jgi:hypothetical protein
LALGATAQACEDAKGPGQETELSVEPERYEYVDALRGYAILGVIAVHTAGAIAPASLALQRMATEGARGVQLQAGALGRVLRHAAPRDVRTVRIAARQRLRSV